MTEKNNYTVTRLKCPPFVGMLMPLIKNPLGFVMGISQGDHGDIVSFKIFSENVLQVNHPELIRRILVDNQKNYIKSKQYIRFESVGGLGLITSNGEKWKRDRQKIQPMFNREQLSNYYFSVTNLVAEKYKQRWLKLTENSKVEIDMTEEMVKLTTEIILRSIFGNKISDETVTSLYHSYSELIDYLKKARVLYNVDLRKVFCHPAYFKFKKELDNVDSTIRSLCAEHRNSNNKDKYNMLSLLIEAQKADPENFSETDIRDHAVTMVFAGFETTSLLMQWMWYVLDDYATEREKLRSEIITTAPCTTSNDSSSLTFEEVKKMDYMTMVLKETMRLYPPLWHAGRDAVEDDNWGDFTVKKKSSIIIPIISLQRNPKYWQNPNSFIPERFSPENETKIDDGIYLPFMHGGRKCSGHMFVDMEARTIIAKLLPMFSVTCINKLDNPVEAGLSLKLKKPLMVELDRLSRKNTSLP